MTNPSLQYSKTELSHQQSRYNFHSYESTEIVLGWFDCFDTSGIPLDFCHRELYTPLSHKWPELRFASVHQIHGITLAEIPSVDQIFSNYGPADGLLSKATNMALTMRTADCVPVFLWNRDFCALLHCGYKSIVKGILQSFENSLSSISSKEFHCKCGPHILPCCFEIKQDVLELFREYQLFSPHDIMTRRNRMYLNLQRMIQRWHRNLCPSGSFFATDQCTCCQHHYHSYRRENSASRMGSLIFKKELGS